MQTIARFLFVAVCFTLAGTQAGAAEEGRRVAFLIGNSAYTHTRALPNPRNDAEAIARLLESNGFAVTLKSDLDYRAMREAVRAFGETAREADVALLYYAGHGVEASGQNYLLPIDAKLVREADLEYEAITLGSVLNAAAGARRLRVVILDACRNNPLGDRMQLASGATRAVTRGLARIEPRGDVLVGYAAKEGTLARDGTGPHSPYAEALLTHLATPGLDVGLMFRRVRDHVLAATHSEQEPFTYGSLSGETVPLVPGAALPSAQRMELELWHTVKDNKTPGVLRTYLDRYPDGEFATVARALIEQYERELQAEAAARETARKRAEEEFIAAEVKRLQKEQAGTAAGSVESDLRAKTDELRKLTDRLREVNEAVAASEKRSRDAAEAAKKAAEQAKRESAKTGGTEKVAALPKLDVPQGTSGSWAIQWSIASGCMKSPRSSGAYILEAKGGVLSGHNPGGPMTGKVSDGSISWTFSSPRDGATFNCSGSVRGGQGSGTCVRALGNCIQRFTARRI